VGFVSRAWKGEEKLWKVFWIYNIVLSAVLSVAIEFIPVQIGAISYAVLFFCLAWAILISVALWTCAFNADWAGWGYLIRAMIVLAVVALVSIFIGLLPEADSSAV
jgi:hypothetical protein